MHFVVFNCVEIFTAKDLITILFSFAALAFSITTFILSRRLNIKQSILKTALDKAKDCNDVWDKERLKNNVSDKTEKYSAPYYDTISELVISKELITISYDLFSASNKDKEKFVTASWKQLKTGIRGFYISESFKIAKKFNEEYNCKSTYCKQVLDIYGFISIGDLENSPDISLIEELKKYKELKES